ncbi:MAG: hypothetical protein HQK97_06050 [Nitrospirae bacterium]|nr:hypothetical protein [Nitrospirota bacterium]
MDKNVISDNYVDALGFVITSQAQALNDKHKAGAFIALFLQSILNKYGKAALKQVIEAIKKQLPPEALKKLVKCQGCNKGMTKPPCKKSSPLQRLRNKTKKWKLRQ